MIPKRLIIEPTTRCNFNCVHCYKNYIYKHDFNINWLNNIFPILPYIDEVVLFGWGEPLLFDKLKELFIVLKNKKNDLKTYITTNGSLLNKDWIYFFTEQKLTYLAISIDSISGNNLLRDNINLKRIENLVKMLKSNYPEIVLRVTTTLSKYNLNHLENILKWASKNNFDEMKIVYLYPFNNKLEKITIFDQDIKKIQKKFEILENLSKKVDIILRIPTLKKVINCNIFERDIFIAANGDIKPCISYKKIDLNIKNIDILSALNSKIYKDNIKKIIKHGICDFCYKCDFLNFSTYKNNKNG